MKRFLIKKHVVNQYCSQQSSKDAQGFCQPNKDSVCYTHPLHTHDKDHFQDPQYLKNKLPEPIQNGF